MRAGAWFGGSWLGVVAALCLAASAAGHVGSAPPAAAPGCPAAVDPGTVASVEQLAAGNRAMARFGRRPTASPNHDRFVAWVERRLRSTPGLEVREIPYRIDRWLERGASLTADGRRIPIAGVVPYAEPTRGTTGELVHIPHGTAIGDEAKGKVVLRDAVPGEVPNAVFGALMWWAWDPEQSFLPDETKMYERDFLSYMERVDDLRAAATAGAAGVVFVHDFPRAQVRDQYAPYEGERWKLPALQVGADEGERLKALAEEGTSARIALSAAQGPASTSTLVATLPGMSDERILVESHTDGMNAIWDNGPIAILALAEHFAALPRECRPRTLEFVFTTAHLYQQLKPPTREGAAEQYAQELDRTYDEGKVAMVMALEHMGAREYAAVPRAEGLPGRRLELTGRTEPTGIFIGESPVLVEAVAQATIARDLRRTLGLRGADLPGARIPPHHSFGGEATPFHKHLIPTVGLVTGPWSLYNPAFGMEAVDHRLMHAQTLVFGDLIHRLGSESREAIAGGYLGYREARRVLCGADEHAFGLAECPH
jgi:hypothetical protein